MDCNLSSFRDLGLVNGKEIFCKGLNIKNNNFDTTKIKRFEEIILKYENLFKERNDESIKRINGKYYLNS